MIEIKNNFLGSKMNKDIDDRLVPKNQYRHAVNLEINRSENSDAGTVQNILGNSLVTAADFRTITGVNNLDCIGVYANASTDELFIFLTDNTDTSVDGNVYNPNAKNYIYVYNNIRNQSTLLVQGAFLNFSKNKPVLGINVLENFLLWTDNRNQPRKINITKATSSSTYYVAEEQISVAKPSPLEAPLLYKQRSSEEPDAPNEYETAMYNVSSKFLPTGTGELDENPYYIENYVGDAAYLEDKFVRFSYRYKFEDGEYSIMAPFTQIAYIPKQDGYFMYEAGLEETNPIKDDETAAYRSTIVSFMENKVNQIKLQILLPDITVYPPPPPATQFVPRLEPCPANQLATDLKITNIEILYKDANDLNISVVDSIPTLPDSSQGTIEEPYFWNTTGTVYEYVYDSKKPFKTLPTSDSIRVNDIVPIRALGQEIISNRIVYSNYQNKASYPKYLNYNVGYGVKAPFVAGTSKTSKIEYPNHSVKENRNYQVGVVLADRFGRESGVILSSAIKSIDAAQFGISSLYVQYRDAIDSAPSIFPGTALKVLFNDPIDSGPTGWPGIYNGNIRSSSYNPLGWYSYKIVVKQTEQDYYNVYFPGFMASYPGTIYPNSPETEVGKTSHVVLINDNINKVPRDLTEVGPAQLQFRSSVVLYPRVTNTDFPYDNRQFYPGNSYSFVNTIATNNSLFFGTEVDPNLSVGGYDQFYQIDSNPLIARISTPSLLGVISTGDVINLSVAETKPFESKLDIYWETSTVGLISELNALIETESGGAANMSYTSSFFTEASTGAAVRGIKFTDEFDEPIELDPSQVSLKLVKDGTNAVVTNKFQLVPASITGEFDIVTAPGELFVYQAPLAKNQFSFTISTNSGVPSSIVDYAPIVVTLINVAPTITSPPINQFYQKEEGSGNQNIITFTGVNGASYGADNQLGLVWSLDPPVANFSISQLGVLTANTNLLSPGSYTINVKLTDASGEGNVMTRSCDVGITPATSQYKLSGGTSGRSFTYLDANGTTQYAELGPNVEISRCLKNSNVPAEGATYLSACTTVPNECAVFMLNGGTSGRTFTYYAPGASVTTSLSVPANQSYTKYIKTPYNTTGAVQMATATSTCPVPTCLSYTLSGGTTGRTFNFDDCYTGFTQLTIAANQSTVRCIQHPYYATGAVSGGACASEDICTEYTLNGGTSGRSFTYTPCGETGSITNDVDAGLQETDCIAYGFYNEFATPGNTCLPPVNCGYSVLGTQQAAVTEQTTYSGTISITGNQITVQTIAQGECESGGCTAGQTTLDIFENGSLVLSVSSGTSSGGQLATSDPEMLPIGDYTYQLTVTPILFGNSPLSGGFYLNCPTGTMVISNQNLPNSNITITGVYVNGESVELVGIETFPLAGGENAFALYAVPTSISSGILVTFAGNTIDLATQMEINTQNPQIDCEENSTQADFFPVDLTEEVSVDIRLYQQGLSCT